MLTKSYFSQCSPHKTFHEWGKCFLLFIFSFLIVALGQPQTSPSLSLLSSICGFAPFWISLFYVKRTFLYSTLWFFLVQLVQLFWLASTTYQGMYILFVYIGLAMGLGVQFGILALFFPKKPPLTLYHCLGMAAFWTLMEWSRIHILCGFVWNPVGLAHTAYPICSQLATIGGIFGLSFWVMFINFLAVNVLIKFRKKAFYIWGSALLVSYIFGWLHIQYHHQKSLNSSNFLNVALIQTALLPDQKVHLHQRKEQYISPYQQWKNILLYLEKHQSKKLDLIVLPEAAVPYGAYHPRYEYTTTKNIMRNIWGEVDLNTLLIEPFIKNSEDKIYINNAFWAQAIADNYDAEVVIGLDDFDEKHNYNAAFHFIPHQSHVTRYEKRILLPLAEYLPFSFLRPLIARYGIESFFTHGKQAKVMEGKCPLSISICYEECFSHLIREGRLKGAKLFVNITNDAWYPYSHLPQQHFDHGKIRSIENGVPLVRACNTGVTAGIDSLGRTVSKFMNPNGSFEQKQGALFLSINLYTFSTLYTLWGDYFILSLSFSCVLLFIIYLVSSFAFLKKSWYIFFQGMS